MATKVKNTESNKTADKKPNEKLSKTWLAMLANKGTGKILDTRAVLK